MNWKLVNFGEKWRDVMSFYVVFYLNNEEGYGTVTPRDICDGVI